MEALPTEVASAAAALPNNPEPDEASVEARCTNICARLRAASPYLRHIAAHLRLRAALPHNPAPLEEANTPRAVHSETSDTPRAVIETFEIIERALVKVLGPECSLKPHELCYYNGKRCEQRLALTLVWMTSGARPKKRSLCLPCSCWLLKEGNSQLYSLEEFDLNDDFDVQVVMQQQYVKDLIIAMDDTVDFTHAVVHMPGLYTDGRVPCTPT